MKKSYLFFYCIFLVTAPLFSQSVNSSASKNLVDKICIETKTNRIFSFTNKAFGQYHGETNCYTNDGWRGWVLREQKIFTDYAVTVDTKLLDRTKSTTDVLPYKITRSYRSGQTEQIFFADSLDVLAIEIRNIKPFAFSFIGFSGTNGRQVSNRVISFSLGSVLPGFTMSIISNVDIQKSTSDSILFTVGQPASQTKMLFIVHKANEPSPELLPLIDKLIIEKRNRINSVLNRSCAETNDKEFNKAYLWCAASFDALITKQESKGIFAGLPWFNNNWGRDTFISLPGCFVTGNFEDAKEILEAFATYQDTVQESKYFGRIPNRVTLKDIIYNTADGTPWFVIQCENYFLNTGDTAFIKKMYPYIRRALQASLMKRCDKFGLLTHLDAETWMDAVGPDGPWSPRGNRADDIQVLWYKQILATNRFAKLFEDDRTDALTSDMSQVVKQSISKYFIDEKNCRIADRLSRDGQADYSIRPNAFFVLNQRELFSGDNARIAILKNLMYNLVLPYGVLSLDYHDVNFHPYHEYPPFYPKDAAYHNGIIWQWNSGPVVQALCSFGLQDSAWMLTKELTRQILHDGAAGSIAELMEAMPRTGKDYIKLSGAFSQAWSLGEYLRCIHEEYFGAKVDVSTNTLQLCPRLPKSITSSNFTVRFRDELIPVLYKVNKNNFRVELYVPASLIDVTIHLSLLANGNCIEAEVMSGGAEHIVINYAGATAQVTVSADGKAIEIHPVIISGNSNTETLLKSITFAKIPRDTRFPVLQAQTSELIPHGVIKKSMPANAKVIFNQADPANDEKYSYPLHPFFAKGILDITHFTLSEDNNNLYFVLNFSKLINPNWHAEYGFQLTFAGIYLRVEDDSVYTQTAGKNSKYNFIPERKFNRVIYVGGGFEIRNAKNQIVAAYTPEKDDANSPLGNSKTGEISFSIPKKYIGKLSKGSCVSILVGAQDDHGGSGIGEFREVNARQSEWNGGGKTNPDDDNVYDTLFIN
jgi:glycogen debranching enzyme